MNYVALIRGIMPSNPSMSNANLCRVIAGLGYDNVRSVIASGNVIFSSDDTDEVRIQDKITHALQSELGISGTTIVRSQAELEQLLEARPFGGQVHSNETYQTLTFLRTENPSAALPEDLPIDIKRATNREICLVSNNTATSGPDLMRVLQRTYGTDITTRTWKTVERIVAKLREIGA